MYVPVEVLVGTWATVRHSFLDNTVSDLGAVTCTTIVRSSGPVPLCSPGHTVMNTAFVVFGLLMAAGAVLLHGRFASGRTATAITALLVVAGLSSAAVGLVPLDARPDLHVLVAAPIFAAQPLALILLGRSIRGHGGAALVVTGIVSLLAGIGFGVLDLDHGRGLLERIALWPTFVALAALGLGVLCSGQAGPRPRSTRSARSA